VIHVNVLEFGADPVPIGLDVPLPADGAATSPVNATVLYIPVPRWANPRQIDTHVNLLDDQYRQSAELVVIRIHPQRLADFGESNAAEDIAERFPGTPVLLLSWRGDFFLEPCGGPPLGDLGVDDEALTYALRHADARALVERSGVILPADETFHYEGPNGRHYESFVRVGTAIQSVDSLDGLAFWLLNQLARSPLIVLDSWTILSLGLNCERYLNQVEQALHDPSSIEDPGEDRARVVAVECQRRYGEPRGRLQQRLSNIHKQSQSSPPPVLVLMSVSSTGDSANALSAECARAGFEQIQAVSLFTATETKDEGFCALPEITKHWHESECPHCRDGSQSVRVMADTYLLDLAAAVRSDVVIRVLHVQQAREFFERYAGAEIVSVHRTQEGDERHHALFLDVNQLLSHETFLQRLDAELEELADVQLVLCPEHRAGEGLAATVAEKLGVPTIAADPKRLPSLSAEERALFDGVRKLLIVDDIVMTGTRLRRYRNYLHRAGLSSDADFELHFLAGVARPDSLRRLQGIVDYAHFPQRFHYVELLILPNWGRDECPWCAELDLLKQYSSYVEDSPILEGRLQALKDTASGLQADLFLHWAIDNPPPVGPWQLGPGSIFGVRTEAELFAGVANALQVLRSEGELNERFTLPVAKVLDQRFAFSGRFYDTVITACLLRATRRHDLRAPAIDRDLEAEVRERLQDGSHVSLQGELLFALYRRHLPGNRLNAVRYALADSSAESGIRQLLSEALDAREEPVS
jgi:hypothetical protein